MGCARNAPRDLPEDLALPLDSGAPWWYWLGARPSIDFVNTLRERWRRRSRRSSRPTTSRLWLQRAELTDRPDARPASRARRGARAARGDRRVRVRRRRRRARPRDAVTLIDDWLVHAGDRPQLRARGRRAAARRARRRRLAAPRARARSRSTPRRCSGRPAERARMRICASDTCSARFYDRSPAGRRRWCSMQPCGNAAKARRHRARRRELTRVTRDRCAIAGSSSPSGASGRWSPARCGRGCRRSARVPRRVRPDARRGRLRLRGARARHDGRARPVGRARRPHRRAAGARRRPRC